jgi:hypothetical protein
MNFSIIEITNTDFQIENCKVFHYRNEDNFRVNIFFLEADSHTLDKIWKRFSNMVAANYQNHEYMGDSKFEKWNFYIIYVSKDIVSKELKNKIENDKFSSRKIVEDAYEKELNNEEANRLIVKHITNADLKEIVEATQETSISAYVPANKKLWELLAKEEKVSGDRKAQEEFIKQINEL